MTFIIALDNTYNARFLFFVVLKLYINHTSSDCKTIL